MPIPAMLAEQDSTRIYQIGRTGFDSGDADSEVTESSTTFADNGTGAGAAPDEGLLNNPSPGYITRVDNAYEFTQAGYSRIPAWYTTELPNDDFEYYADIQRAPNHANDGGDPGLLFFSDGTTVDGMYLCLDRVDDNNVAVRFERYDGAHQDDVVLETGIALAYEAWIRLGVRVASGVITAYRADPSTGDNEVSLGTITETSSPTWIGDATHHHVGVVKAIETLGQGVAWDNLTFLENTVNTGTAYTGTIKSEKISPFQRGGMFQPSAGELGKAHFRRVGLRILHTGGFTITVTAWVDGTQTQIWTASDPTADESNQTIDFTVSAPTASDPTETLLEADIDAKGTYIEVQIEVTSTNVTGIFLPESVEVHARPLRTTRQGTDAESQ